jgi:hypothetical protein
MPGHQCSSAAGKLDMELDAQRMAAYTETPGMASPASRPSPPPPQAHGYYRHASAAPASRADAQAVRHPLRPPPATSRDSRFAAAYFATQRNRHQLRTQTNAQQRPLQLQAQPYACDLIQPARDTAPYR